MVTIVTSGFTHLMDISFQLHLWKHSTSHTHTQSLLSVTHSHHQSHSHTHLLMLWTAAVAGLSGEGPPCPHADSAHWLHWSIPLVSLPVWTVTATNKSTWLYYCTLSDCGQTSVDWWALTTMLAAISHLHTMNCKQPRMRFTEMKKSLKKQSIYSLHLCDVLS